MRAPGPTQNLHLITDITGDLSVLRNPKQNVYFDNLVNDGVGFLLNYHIQYGQVTTNLVGAATITFPAPFGANPVIFLSPASSLAYLILNSSTGITIQTYDVDGSTPVGSISVSWMAIGTPA